MAQSGMGISVKDYSAMTANTCPSVLASSFLPSPACSIWTDSAEPVCPSSRSNNPTSIVVQTTGSKHEDIDDHKKGFEETPDPGLLEWAAAQLPHLEIIKEDIEWRTLKHPGLGLILVGIMAGVICWIGLRKYPPKDSFEIGLYDDLRDFDFYGGIDNYWSPCGSIKTESDSSSDEGGKDPDEDFAFGDIPPHHRKMPKESPDYPSMAGNSYMDPQLPIIGDLGSTTAHNLQSRASLVEEQGKDVIESP
jgi:hypothetical protein